MSRVTMKQRIPQAAREYSSGGFNDIVFNKIEKDGVEVIRRCSTVEEFSNVIRKERAIELEHIKDYNRLLRRLIELQEN